MSEKFELQIMIESLLICHKLARLRRIRQIMLQEFRSMSRLYTTVSGLKRVADFGELLYEVECALKFKSFMSVFSKFFLGLLLH